MTAKELLQIGKDYVAGDEDFFGPNEVTEHMRWLLEYLEHKLQEAEHEGVL